LIARPESWSRPADRTIAAVAAAVAAVATLALAWALMHHAFWARDQIRDTPLYERYGDAMARGEVPYRDFDVEYPPGALLPLVVPSLVTAPDDGEPTIEYHETFERTMLVCGAFALVFMAAALVGLQASATRLRLALAFAALAPLALGSVVLSRFDLWPAALTVSALAALLAGRQRLGAGVLAVAVSAKLYPAVLVPLAGVWIWRRSGRREALVAAAVFVLVLAAIVVPFLVVAPEGVAESVWRQLRRPLQVESLGAAVLVSLHHLAGLRVEIRGSAGSQNIAGARGAAVAVVQTALQLAVLVWLWVRFARGPAERERLVRFAAAAVVAFVALGKVLSPQFLIWLLPLVPLVAGRRGVVAAALLGTALVLTQLWFPYRYWDYAGSLDGTVTALVLARDLVLVALLVVLTAPPPAALRRLAHARSRRSR
jgi:hypothetical protein